MKRFLHILTFISISLLLLVNSYQCEDKPKDECNDYRTPSWLLATTTIEHFDPAINYARFSRIVEVTNVCIDKLAHFNIDVTEKANSKIYEVDVWTMVPNSTDIDFRLDHKDNKWTKSMDMNVMQGFNKSPGSFKLRVDIYIISPTEYQAQGLYDSSVEELDIFAQYYNYVP